MLHPKKPIDALQSAINQICAGYHSSAVRACMCCAFAAMAPENGIDLAPPQALSTAEAHVCCRRFFQLSADGSTLRWAWNKYVIMYYVEVRSSLDPLPYLRLEAGQT